MCFCHVCRGVWRKFREDTCTFSCSFQSVQSCFLLTFFLCACVIEGHVTMADTQVKSLVSEQYLDGWSYEDDDESGSAPSSPPSSHRNQVHAQDKLNSGMKLLYVMKKQELVYQAVPM